VDYLVYKVWLSLLILWANQQIVDKLFKKELLTPVLIHQFQETLYLLKYMEAKVILAVEENFMSMQLVIS
jgi:hypothetical protein